MRPATLCKALLLWFAVLPLSVSANASPGPQVSIFNFFAPSTSVQKPVVTKRAKAQQAIREHALEYYPVDSRQVDRLNQSHRQPVAKRSRQKADARQSTPQINFFAMW